MEDFRKKGTLENDKEIVFSKAVKAGKRIYYLDVRKNRKDEMFLAITESKKVISDENESPVVSFEKHKIFLYKEDFEKFMHGLKDVMNFVEKEQGSVFTHPHKEDKEEASTDLFSERDTFDTSDEIKIDIDF